MISIQNCDLNIKQENIESHDKNKSHDEHNEEGQEKRINKP